MDAIEAVTIVVPCFNEAERFDEAPFFELANDGALGLVMVNNGSTDDTGELLDLLSGKSEAIRVLDLQSNCGKGEAVRRGLLQAMEDGAEIVGYYDADAATPPDQLIRLIHSLRADPQLMAVFAARVARLGSDVRRSAIRHHVGRAYATVASLALGMDVYDTQCGAKVFRAGDALAHALSMPFPARGTFDVLLIHRLVTGSDGVAPLSPECFLEVPLDAWRNVRGSKMHPLDALAAFVEVVQLLSERTGRRQSRVH